MLGSSDDIGTFDFGNRTFDQDNDPTILPNSVQLIESKMLPIRSSNWNRLSGTYLFCQIYSPEDDTQYCLLCCKYYNSIAELKQHFQAFHDFAVITRKAEYDRKNKFECWENAHLLHQSAYCKATFGSLVDLCDHYIRWHESTASKVLEVGAKLLKSCLYCGLCGEYKNSFLQCLRHLEDHHGMKTSICRYCTYCNPVPGFVENHELQMHVQHYPEAPMKCSVCLMHVRGAERLTKHVMVHHVVQTGTNYWSCSTCLRTYSDPLELNEHLKTCSKFDHVNKSIFNHTFSKKHRIIYTCDSCPLAFASEQEFEKHEDEENHIVGTPEKMIQTSVNMDDTQKCDPSIFDHNTCFLCCMSFATEEMCRKHEHHVHMQWVTKGEADSGQGIEATQDIRELETYQFITSQPVMFVEDKHIPEFKNILDPLIVESVLENDKPFFTDFVEQQLTQIREQPTVSTETNQHQQQSTIYEQTRCVSIPPDTTSMSPESMNLDMAEINNNNGMDSQIREQHIVSTETNQQHQQSTIDEQTGCVSIPPETTSMSPESMNMAEINNNNGMDLNNGMDPQIREQHIVSTETNQQQYTIHEQTGCVSIPPVTTSMLPESMNLDMDEINNNNGMHLNKEVVQSLEVLRAKVCSDIALGAVQVEDELADIGFQSKFGHYCDLCDQVIENYWFYYLHMRHFHRLEKRFKCIVTDCGKVFSEKIEFQDHAFKVHNQKSQHYCRQCDIVFGTVVETQSHTMSSSHRDKLKRLVKKHGRVYPRNHKCSICHCWFGLFSVFVEHMENNGHIYLNTTN